MDLSPPYFGEWDGWKGKVRWTLWDGFGVTCLRFQDLEDPKGILTVDKYTSKIKMA
jgi:hypothetical protein